MEFQIEKNSPVPLIKQIQEQIKLSIAMGILKRGDILPSIREVEKQTGVNRGQIHRAYLALHKSGLLSPAPGKRIAVAVSATASDSISKNCQELAEDIIKRTRKIGVSPIAFARYLSRRVQENERKFPFIAYVDADKALAVMRAEQLSQQWHAAIIGMTVDELKPALAEGSKLRKILVNHLAFDITRRAIRGKNIEVLPIEIFYSEKTIRALEKIKGASILVLLPDHAVPSAHFIVEQLCKMIRHKEAAVSWMAVTRIKNLGQLIDNPKYDRILISPGARSKVPAELHRNPKILLLQMELDQKDLQIARIRAGVLV